MNKCPYCNSEIKYSDKSNFIYGKDFGAVFYCSQYPKCDAYVGCHKEGNLKDHALGRLANSELRKYKKLAHASFDPLWKHILSERKKINKNSYKSYSRNDCYEWLSKQMNISVDNCHIGMFDVELCKKVIEICEPYLIKYNLKNEFKR